MEYRKVDVVQAILLFPVLVGVFLIGCTYLPIAMPSHADETRFGTESKLQVQKYHEDWTMQAQVAGLAFPILTANSDLCGNNIVYDIGIQWVVFNDFPAPDPRYEKQRRAATRSGVPHNEPEIGLIERIAAKTLGILHRPYLIVVAPGSPADKAGLQQGDRLVGINGKPIRKDRGLHFDYGFDPYRGTRPYRWHFRSTLKNAMQDGSPVTIQYLRGADYHKTEVQPIRKCDFDVAALDFAEIASTSEDGILLVSRGLYQSAQSDFDLQAFISHRLAHELIGQRTDSMPGLRDGWTFPWLRLVYLGLGRGNSPNWEHWFSQYWTSYSQVDEIEADYLAMYLLARAGIDVSQYASVWASIPSSSPMRKTHAVFQERFERMSTTHQEIAKKLNEGIPLNPMSN
ncbi:MAG: M48 family metallopeptidase [Gammaproteobacteria bacterium]|nr:M48 family metallopeptidase [Gammaproteobacteria bacterium]